MINIKSYVGYKLWLIKKTLRKGYLFPMPIVYTSWLVSVYFLTKFQYLQAGIMWFVALVYYTYCDILRGDFIGWERMERKKNIRKG